MPRDVESHLGAPVVDAQKISIVKQIFSTVTRRYDFLNHLLSLRRDVYWRRFTVRKMRFFKTHRLMDVATGTADLAIEAVRSYPHIQVFALDFLKEMLEQARGKIERRGLSKSVMMFRGDALNIPAPSDAFDVAGIAFGIRNIPDKFKALKEMTRVAVPGGQVLVLEMSLPQYRYISGLYAIYLNGIIPLLARPFTPNPRAYCYLGESISQFPTPHEFTSLMEDAGLTRVETYSLTLGICHLFVGYKPA
jgi:demethylmenaquinone methyltransferase/2-methoxy-6-polyprenyl-1,4-benzoquinol methylase